MDFLGRVVPGVWVSDRLTPSSEEDVHGENNTPQLFEILTLLELESHNII